MKFLIQGTKTLAVLALSWIATGDKFNNQNLRFSTGSAKDTPMQHQQHADNRGLLNDEDGLKGCWGSWMRDGFCLEKVVDATTGDSDKIKFRSCDNNNPKQMWKFIYPEVGNEENFMLKNMDGGCMGVTVAKPAEGTNVKVVECNRNDPEQHWMVGDTLFLRDNRDLCVAPDISGSTITNDRTKVVLRECDGVASWEGYP